MYDSGKIRTVIVGKIGQMEAGDHLSQLKRMTLRLSRFEDFRYAIPGWRGEFTLLSKGAFEGKLEVVQMPHLRAFVAETNSSLLTKGPADENSVTIIPITRRSQATRWQGRQLERGDILIRGTSIEYHNCTESCAQIEALIVGKRVLQNAMQILSYGELDIDLETWTVIHANPEGAMLIQRQIQMLCHGAISHLSQADTEARILRCLVEALQKTQLKSEHTIANEKQNKLVASVIEYMHANISAPLTALDLCKKFHVSDRLLRHAFHKHYGMGPIAFLNATRINHVKKCLAYSSPHDVLVSDVLWAHGVTRPGSFSLKYFDYFGERPSETLGIRKY